MDGYLNMDPVKGMKEKDDRDQRLLKTMNNGFSISEENNLFVYVSHKLCEMLGYEPREMIGKPVAVFSKCGNSRKGRASVKCSWRSC